MRILGFEVVNDLIPVTRDFLNRDSRRFLFQHAIRECRYLSVIVQQVLLVKCEDGVLDRRGRGLFEYRIRSDDRNQERKSGHFV